MFILEKLRAKNSRSLSGILECNYDKTGEFSCEFDCYYCPNQKDMPRSYVKEEPAVGRAAQNNFDTVLQTFDRIGQYVANGHLDKGEFIILGGIGQITVMNIRKNLCVTCIMHVMYFSTEHVRNATVLKKKRRLMKQHFSKLRSHY